MRRLASAAMLILVTAAPAEEPRRDRFGDPLPPGALARLGTLHVHSGATSIAFRPDGGTLITTGWGAVRQWDPTTGRVRRRITHAADRREVEQVISADGRIAGAVYRDRIEIQTVGTHATLHRISVPFLTDVWKNSGCPYNNLLSISPAGDLLLVRPEEREKNIYPCLVMQNGKLVDWPEMQAVFNRAVYSPDGKWVALRVRGEGQMSEVQLRSTSDGKIEGRFKLAGQIYAFTPNSAALLILRHKESRESVLALVDPKTGQATGGGEVPQLETPTAAILNPDGQRLAVATEKSVRVWDLAAKRELWKSAESATHLAFSPDGRRLAGIDFVLRLWDAGTGKTLTPSFGPFPGHIYAGPPDSHYLIARGERQVIVWDWRTGTPVITAELAGESFRKNAWLSHDATRLYCVNVDALSEYDVASGKLLRTARPDLSAVKSDEIEMQGPPCLVGDGRSIAMLFVAKKAWPKKQCTFVRWEIDTGRIVERRELEAPDFQVAWVVRQGRAVHFLHGFRTGDWLLDLATGRGRVLSEWKARDNAYMFGPRATSPGGRLSVYSCPDDFESSDGTVVLDEATDKPLLRIPGVPQKRDKDGRQMGDRENGPVAISSNGRWLARARSTGIELWDMVAQKETATFGEYETPDTINGLHECIGLEFLPGGHLVADYPDGSALVWELPKAALAVAKLTVSEHTWAELGDAEPLAAVRAAWAVHDDPKAGLELLRRIKPAQPADEKTLAALFADLGSESFAKRDAADLQLQKLGRAAEAFLRQALAKGGNAEQRRRAQRLLDAVQTDRPMNVDERRAARAVYAAELLGDAGRPLLAEWAKGDAGALVTREAQEALRR